MTRIIVTDLTRFTNQDIVCTAGIDVKAGICIRPMPYLKAADCKRLNILPGAMLSGEFKPVEQKLGPHQEDMSYSELQFHGPCTSEEFRIALEVSMYQSVGKGFELELSENQKHVPKDHKIDRSIITIKVAPKNIRVVEDSFNPGKVKLIFTDGAGHQFRYMSITDLGFHLFAEKHQKLNKLDELNEFIASQATIYLRIGLRKH